MNLSCVPKLSAGCPKLNRTTCEFCIDPVPLFKLDDEGVTKLALAESPKLPKFLLGIVMSNFNHTARLGSLNVHIELTRTCPTKHAQVVLPPVEYNPTGHKTHALALLAPTVVEKLPASQSEHAALPLVVLYFPATQAVQMPASPVNPAGQGAALSGVPTGQVKHLSTTAH